MQKFIILLVFLSCITLQAQPFECKGDNFLALSNNGSTIFYRVAISADNNEVEFNPLPAPNSGYTINATGYRSTDNYIYGMEISGPNLCRVDSNGIATIIAPLNGLNPDLVYYAGDISPDGQYLCLLGSGGNPFITRELVYINLDDYSTSSVTIPNAEEVNVFCADFVFDPTTSVLYSFDARSKRLIKFDPVTAMVDNTLYPSSDVADSMGAIYIDAFGNLFGYGEQLDTEIANTFFKIDKNTGAITIGAIGPITTGKDACACPYSVEIQKSVLPKVVLPCDEVTYTFKIANGTSSTQIDLDFLDEMPPELTITEIVRNPYTGNILSGTGSNILSVENLSIPPGVDSIVVRAEVAFDAIGFYKNQAVIKNLPDRLGEEALSDDPSTFATDDSTVLQVIPLELDFGATELGLCSDDTLVLNTGISNAISYLWSDGTTKEITAVTAVGWYFVTVTSVCESTVDSVYVFPLEFDIDLGPDQEIELGDSILLQAAHINNPTFQWLDPIDNSLSCLTCNSNYARPLNDIEYTLTAVDEQGCKTKDQIKITVDKKRYVYLPNAFSPNFDGINDIFYIQGKGYGYIKSFQIFDRWGAVVFKSTGGLINDARYGWDGGFNGTVFNPGTFAYFAKIEFLDGEEMLFEGGVTLIR